MKKLITSIGLVLLFLQTQAQQDAQFSQYMFNGLYINPAYAGYRQQWNVNMFYRTQWTGFSGAPKTFSLAADGSANNDRVGIGFQVMNDKLGAQNNTSFYATYAYRIPLDAYSDKTLALGISGGFVQQQLDVNALDPIDHNDPLLMNAQKTKLMPDARFGVFYNSERFYAGVSADNLITNLFQKDETYRTYLPLKPHMYFTVGGLVPLSTTLLLKPSILVKEDFAGPTSLDLNSFLLIDKKIWVGASYRTAIFSKKNLQSDLMKSSAIVGMIEVFVNDKLRLGYAYDQTINGTAANNYTTHEISLGYFFLNPKAKMLSPRYF